MTENVFAKLNAINVSDFTEAKMGLSYLSWADAWTKVCEIYPDTNYYVYESEDGTPLHKMGTSGYVKVGVTVQGKEIVEYLAVMTGTSNKPMPLDSIMSTDVVKTIQRCATKAIARHGLGMHVYRGEDLPDAEHADVPLQESRAPAKAAAPAPQVQKASPTVDRRALENDPFFGSKKTAPTSAPAKAAAPAPQVQKASTPQEGNPWVSADVLDTKEDRPGPTGDLPPMPADRSVAEAEIVELKQRSFKLKQSVDSVMKEMGELYLQNLSDDELLYVWRTAQRLKQELIR